MPSEYVDQVQHQIFVAEARFAHYYSFDGVKGVLLKVPRNQKRIDQILRAEHDFWQRLQSGKWGSDEWDAAAAAWQQASRQLQEAKAREEQARSLLLAQMPLGRKRYESDGVSLMLSSRKGNVDWRALLKDRGIVLTEDQLDAYRNASVEHTIIRDLDGDIQAVPNTPVTSCLNQSASLSKATTPTPPPLTATVHTHLKKDFVF